MYSAYELDAEVVAPGLGVRGHQRTRYDLFDLERMDRQDASLPMVARVILQKKPQLRFEADATNAQVLGAPVLSRLLAPIVREEACLGLIDLQSRQSEAFTPEHGQFLETATAIAALLYEKDDTLELFKALQEPVDFHLPTESFYEALMELVARASQMPFIVLSEFSDGKELTCIAQSGFPDQSLDSLSLSPIEAYTPFCDTMLEGVTHIERSMQAPHLAALRTLPSLAQVRSFVVCPVKAGTETFGTLSFAAACEYNYTQLETNGFETIANAVGVAIKNHRHYQSQRDNLFQFAQVAAAVSTVEVAQAARHEARSHLQEAQDTLGIIDRLSRAPSRKDLEKIRQHVGQLDETLQDIGRSMDRIKQVTKPPKRELKRLSLRGLWQEAFDMVEGRLNSLKIRYRIDGDAQADVYPDSLRHVFLNLILNSIDAFKEFKKSNRSITVTHEPQSSAANNIVIKYVDTGPGIDPSRFPGSQGEKGLDCIFEAGVTSKDEGSGFGLFLSRRILAHHKGGIRLVDYRNGVVFEITLPKTQGSVATIL
jgi:signal transduction histidine kinase